MPNITTWTLGILATLAGAFGGALFNHFFGTQAAIEAERRLEVRRAAEDYFSKRVADPQAAIGARYRLMMYANSNVLKTFAEANRNIAKADVPKDQRKFLCESQSPNARVVIGSQIGFIAAVRKQTLQGDPLDGRELAAVLCPLPSESCFGQIYVDHLFECTPDFSK